MRPFPDRKDHLISSGLSEPWVGAGVVSSTGAL
jgi:hypothetical protein